MKYFKVDLLFCNFLFTVVPLDRHVWIDFNFIYYRIGDETTTIFQFTLEWFFKHQFIELTLPKDN